MGNDYPIDIRVDYPERSSRLWAGLTIFSFAIIKAVAILPHGIILLFLGIAQVVVAFVAQIVVAVKGEYPEGMFRFVTGVLRWNTRVGAFFFSLTDQYPPFSLQPDASYPVDVVAERPPQSSKIYALFTVLVQVLVAIGVVVAIVWFVRNGGSITSGSSSSGGSGGQLVNWSLNYGSGGLVLRDVAALPHLIIVGVLGLVAFAIWIIVQWVILFVASYPRGMFDVVVGITRWQTRVGGYVLGLIDRYPPFTFDSSLTAQGPAPGYGWTPPNGPGGPAGAPPAWPSAGQAPGPWPSAGQTAPAPAPPAPPRPPAPAPPVTLPASLPPAPALGMYGDAPAPPAEEPQTAPAQTQWEEVELSPAPEQQPPAPPDEPPPSKGAPPVAPPSAWPEAPPPPP